MSREAMFPSINNLGATPGPWALHSHDEEDHHFRVRGTCLGAKWKIANVPYLVESAIESTEAQANARLIAAAPEMYEALRMIVGTSQDHYDENAQRVGVLLDDLALGFNALVAASGQSNPDTDNEARDA